MGRDQVEIGQQASGGGEIPARASGFLGAQRDPLRRLQEPQRDPQQRMNVLTSLYPHQQLFLSDFLILAILEGCEAVSHCVFFFN